VGRRNRSAIGTMVERCSRFTRLIQLPAGHTADDLHDALTQVLVSMPDRLRATLTAIRAER
jgi:transposase, IS30 family